MPRICYSPEVRTDILRRIHGGEPSHAQAAREVGCSLFILHRRAGVAEIYRGLRLQRATQCHSGIADETAHGQTCKAS
jgi:hypothetical protein